MIRPVSETQTISVMTSPAPPIALPPRCTRWKSSGMPPAEFTAFQKTEIEKWARIVKAANVKID